MHCWPVFAVGWDDLKVRDIIKMLEDGGWYPVAMKGSHRQYKHMERPGRIMIAGHKNDALVPGTSVSILKQAGLKEEK